jgi:anaphase-promoting complex subunit 8
MTTPGGDLRLARDYIERVATSNSSDVQEASEMLKKVQAMLQARADTVVTSAAVVED